MHLSEKSFFFFVKFSLYLLNYWLQETWLLKCVKGPVSKHPLAVNVLTDPKYCWNLHGSTFILFLHHFRIDQLTWKTSLIVRPQMLCQFKRNYVRNQKRFVTFLLCFWNLHKIWNILKKKMSLIDYVFANLWTPKDVVT